MTCEIIAVHPLGLGDIFGATVMVLPVHVTHLKAV